MLVVLQQLHSFSETSLSDKERARVNDIQEVPKAAIEGCLEKGVGEKSRSAAIDHPPATGEPNRTPHPSCWGPIVPRTPHVGDEYQRGLTAQ